MLAVTDRFLAAIRDSHTISVAARVYRPGRPAEAIDVPVIGGNVTADRDGRIRRTGSLEVAFTLGDGFTREALRELPFGGEAVVERGVRYADGTSERVQLGRFRVESIVWRDLEGNATLTLADRMAQINDERFLTPYVPAPGIKPSSAVSGIVYEVFGDEIGYSIETTPATEPDLADVVYEEDRGQAVSDLAASVGAAAFFDTNGDFVLRPKRQAYTPVEVVWTLDAGERGTLIAVSETLDRSNVRNGVIVRGQAAADAPPITAIVTHEDPSSMVQWGGPFGQVALISSSSAVSSQAQADQAARALLKEQLGFTRTLSLVGVPNPALEPDDVIDVVFADGRREQHTINAVQVGLEPGGELEITTTSLYEPRIGPSDVYVSPSAVWRPLEPA